MAKPWKLHLEAQPGIHDTRLMIARWGPNSWRINLQKVQRVKPHPDGGVLCILRNTEKVRLTGDEWQAAQQLPVRTTKGPGEPGPPSPPGEGKRKGRSKAEKALYAWMMEHMDRYGDLTEPPYELDYEGLAEDAMRACRLVGEPPYELAIDLGRREGFRVPALLVVDGPPYAEPWEWMDTLDEPDTSNRRTARAPDGTEYTWRPLSERHHHSPILRIVHRPLADEGSRWAIGIGRPLYDALGMPEEVVVSEQDDGRIVIWPCEGLTSYHVHVARNRLRYWVCDDLAASSWMVPGDYRVEVLHYDTDPRLVIVERLPDMPGKTEYL